MWRKWTALYRALCPGLDKLAPSEAEALLDHQDDRRLLCAACRSPVTDESQRIEVGGAHEHAFRNPNDLTFHIGCFADAAGCAARGTPTLEWTWFAGHAWQVALCRGCHAHLGWRYRRPEGGTFHGLILDRLIPESSSS